MDHLDRIHLCTVNQVIRGRAEFSALPFSVALFCAKRGNSSLYFAGTVIYPKGDSIYNNGKPKRMETDRSVMVMTVRERVLAIKLLEQQEKHPEYLRKLGVYVSVNKVESTIINMNEEEKEIV